jgi:hypothetical protein
MVKHRGAAIHWFQNGHPMKTLVERHEEMMGVDEKTAVKFCTEWYKSKRQETSAIWKQRKLRNTNTHEFSMSELQEQVAEMVIRKRNMRPPEETLPNEEYRKLRSGKEKNQIYSQCFGGQWQEKPKAENLELKRQKEWKMRTHREKTPENFKKRNRRRNMENTKTHDES